MWRIPTLQALLHEYKIAFRACPRGADAIAVIGWGRKSSGEAARRYADRHGLRFLCLEDGFLRSIGLGRTSPPLSIVVDDLGVYYDATSSSRLERLIASQHDEYQRRRARDLTSLWRTARVSKYNHARTAALPIEGSFVLAVDQTAGDASIQYGLAEASSFRRMLDAALSEYPHLPVVLKVHPDVISGRKQGHFNTLTPGEAARVLLLATDAHPPDILYAAHAVYTVTSQMGFEGLLWGKPVRTFGMPFYAGWGVTQDDVPAPGRRSSQPRVSIEDLVHAALVEYPRYIDPETGMRCEVERLVEWMGLQRRMRERFPAQIHAVNFSAWKRPIVRAFFGGSAVNFVERDSTIPAGGTLAVWGRSGAGDVQTSAPGDESRTAGEHRSPPRQVLRLEDGFLRSVGLGADLVRPLSWVIDRRGIYYDATTPSDLEWLLQETAFDPPLLERAKRLRERITQAGITKYNVGSGEWARPATAQRVVLVPGQVESDASIALGARGVRTNIALLQAVRQVAPEAHIVYKPHPDVVAKLRRAGAGEADASRYCDEIVVDTPMHLLLDRVDEVHVLTSLAGFEALLRGKPVTCHGSPFYAGWGLTTDVHAHPRRTRRLALDELVAATLILYPTYVSRTTGAFTTPERALDELLDWRSRGRSEAGWWRKGLRWVLGWRRR
ncbi:capsular polysaccharide biosynthesis protein [Schlegelella sp. S2-27]|uniref:Capsular polysaccharide biosynthesis protein n=1 Tax=Caldimonas mangrovi TaxID=2944811 RepID=A0ABT0YK34_9BURK|nr:capsular polysaccharide biosynthesis protein [Caldimonas mangrovi]